MYETYEASKAGMTVIVVRATNRADAQYRYEHEVVTFEPYNFVGTRQAFLDWYASCHEFELSPCDKNTPIPPPSEW